MSKTKIGVVVGSARRDAYSYQIARAVIALMPENLEMVMINIADLPLFNQDYDDDNATPPEWARFRGEIKDCAGFLFVAPEYNRSYTPLMKNALDIGSRPYGQNVWAGKPGAVIGTSPGSMGAFGAVSHLRQVLAFLDVRIMNQPEVYLGGVAALLDKEGHITTERTQTFLKSFAAAFGEWVGRFSA